MHFLITNDDGFKAAGLRALVEMASELGRVTVIAPATEQSYVGHRVTTSSPLILKDLGGGQYHLAGTPADCVRVAIRALDVRPDWILSGINHGGNLGVDVYTSGTVAGAREGAFLGIPAIAFSQLMRRPDPVDWEASRRLAANAFARIASQEAVDGRYWNVNLPHPVTRSETVPILDCPLDRSPLDVVFTQSEDGYLYCGHYVSRPSKPGADVAQCFAGNLTMTALDL